MKNKKEVYIIERGTKLEIIKSNRPPSDYLMLYKDSGLDDESEVFYSKLIRGKLVYNSKLHNVEKQKIKESFEERKKQSERMRRSEVSKGKVRKHSASDFTGTLENRFDALFDLIVKDDSTKLLSLLKKSKVKKPSKDK